MHVDQRFWPSPQTNIAIAYNCKTTLTQAFFQSIGKSRLADIRAGKLGALADHNGAVNYFYIDHFAAPAKRVGRGGGHGFEISLKKLLAVDCWNHRAPLQRLVRRDCKPRNECTAIIHSWPHSKLALQQIKRLHLRQRLHALKFGRKLAHVFAQRLRVRHNHQTYGVRGSHVDGIYKRGRIGNATGWCLILILRLSLGLGLNMSGVGVKRRHKNCHAKNYGGSIED